MEFKKNSAAKSSDDSSTVPIMRNTSGSEKNSKSRLKSVTSDINILMIPLINKYPEDLFTCNKRCVNIKRKRNPTTSTGDHWKYRILISRIKNIAKKIIPKLKMILSNFTISFLILININIININAIDITIGVKISIGVCSDVSPLTRLR